MNPKLRLMKLLLGLGALLLAAVPSPALAHDNLGGDELSMANYMLLGALVTIVMGLLAGVWAIRAGQFNNVEESKYRMIELSDDYEAIMAEAEKREEVDNVAQVQAQATKAGVAAPVATPPATIGASRADHAAQV